eukprot:m.296787 g.296787  ORF g.296787 m.296787 type:complete len:64 (+) comp73194_c0_seq1:37-228(+)
MILLALIPFLSLHLKSATAVHVRTAKKAALPGEMLGASSTIDASCHRWHDLSNMIIGLFQLLA